MTIQYFRNSELVMRQGMPVPPHTATAIRVGTQRTKSLYIGIYIPAFIRFVADHYLGSASYEPYNSFNIGHSPAANAAIVNAMRILTRYIEIKYGKEFSVGAEIANLTHKLVAAYNYYCEPESYVCAWGQMFDAEERIAVSFMSLQLFTLIIEDTPGMPQTLNAVLNSKLI